MFWPNSDRVSQEHTKLIILEVGKNQIAVNQRCQRRVTVLRKSPPRKAQYFVVWGFIRLSCQSRVKAHISCFFPRRLPSPCRCRKKLLKSYWISYLIIVTGRGMARMEASVDCWALWGQRRKYKQTRFLWSLIDLGQQVQIDLEAARVLYIFCAAF